MIRETIAILSISQTGEILNILLVVAAIMILVIPTEMADRAMTRCTMTTLKTTTGNRNKL